MFLRRIRQREVRAAVAYGEVINERLYRTPFPTYLFLYFVGCKPIHVVLSYGESTDTGYVVTAYIPDPNLLQADFRRRR